MLLQNIKLILVFGLVLTFSVGVSAAPAWKIVHGDVLQVFPEQHKLLLESGGEKLIYKLDTDCQILRLGAPASLESMHPVAPDAFQDVLCWVNPQGLLGLILVNYSVQEEDGTLVLYDIFGNLK
ncbi:MAG: hypothetical protein GX251_00575 [Firmicutes bacterium]|nr:hypothetical protein [Bacillota bacterium]